MKETGYWTKAVCPYCEWDVEEEFTIQSERYICKNECEWYQRKLKRNGNKKLKLSDIKYIDIFDWYDPVMIWDVLDWMYKWYNEIDVLWVIDDIIHNEWDNKRKPIEEQSDECIEYIYNLINK